MAKLYDPFGVIAKQRQLARDLVDAVRASDVERFADALDALDHEDDAFTRAMRDVAKLPRPSAEFQSWCFQLWLCSGDHLRDLTNGANVLAAGLRVLLPPYTGPALTIYRGDSWFNRCRRTYGLSWTTSIEVARHFASDTMWRTFVGGSVLLETMAPADAIVCAPGLTDDRMPSRRSLSSRDGLARSLLVRAALNRRRHDKLSWSHHRCAPTAGSRHRHRPPSKAIASAAMSASEIAKRAGSIAASGGYWSRRLSDALKASLSAAAPPSGTPRKTAGAALRRAVPSPAFVAWVNSTRCIQ